MLQNLIIGTRRGERNEVEPAEEIAAGSHEHLGATVDVRGEPGWVHATWTVWEAGRCPRVVYQKMFNATGPTTLFVHLDWSAVSGGWAEGTITCDFKTAQAAIAAGAIRVVPRR